MIATSPVERRALEMRIVNRWDVLEARKFQLEMRLLGGGSVGVVDALLLRGLIEPAQRGQIIDAAGGSDDNDTVRFEKLRFGDVAVERGYVTPAQLEEALDFQRRIAAAGLPHKMVGEILVKFRYITPEDVRDIVSELIETARP
jgi:hypothetical protein